MNGEENREIDSGGPAFPVPAEINPNGPQGGMTLRQYYAGQIVASTAQSCPIGMEKEWAKFVFLRADALIAHEREGR